MADLPLDEKAQKEQLGRLQDSVLPFAERMLKGAGEFYPFGGTMNAQGVITQVGGYTGSERPKFAEVIALLKEGFRKQAESRQIVASALVYDVRVIPPGSKEKTDAVAVSLDHRGGMSIIMLYPYRISADKQVSFGQPFAQKGSGDVFRK